MPSLGMQSLANHVGPVAAYFVVGHAEPARLDCNSELPFHILYQLLDTFHSLVHCPSGTHPAVALTLLSLLCHQSIL